ncbi:hypothetical protein ACQR3Q_04895 [Dietzia natronolimnaea]|uniref:hypothetical protein n=1 Tax=Dietzia natronolimnaea TaxID=161920 RepID=UPI003D147751
MRARLARPRRIVRGRLVAPVAAAAAVALVAGVVVATPNAPTVDGDVQTVAVSVPAGNASASYSFNFSAALEAGEWAGVTITDITGLPEGLSYDGNGGITGTAQAGVYNVTVVGTQGAGSMSTPVSIPVTVTINDADGNPPSGAVGGQAQAGAQLTTGSDGTDAILGAVVSIVTSLGGEAAADFVTGSVGGGQTLPDNTEQQPSAPFGSDANGQLNLGSLGNGTPTDGTENPVPNTGSGSSGNAGVEADGNATGGLNTDSLGPLGSLIDTNTEGGTNTTGSTTGGDLTVDGDLTGDGNLPAAAQLEIPGSSSPVDTGSLGNLAPGLAFTGAALLGLAGLGLALSGGSSIPGSTAFLPALPGSTTTNGTTTGGSSNSPSTGGSSGSTAPTVAAGAPRQVQAPGPTVANGRG